MEYINKGVRVDLERREERKTERADVRLAHLLLGAGDDGAHVRRRLAQNASAAGRSRMPSWGVRG